MKRFDPIPKGDSPEVSAARLEELLAECIERLADEGDDAVNDVCTRHPRYADDIRTKLASLERIGLLVGERDLTLPARIGPYRVLRRVGQGGMSVVFLAEDERLGRRVALKTAAFGAGADGRARERFEREVRAVARLEHPCIVPIHDVGEHEGQPYFTMEHVEGATLDSIVDEIRTCGTPLDELSTDSIARATGLEGQSADATGVWGRTYVETVCRVVLDVAQALAHAHAHGIVHRDVKPSNVMVRRDGRAQLFDFGLAHLEDQPALTRSGDFTGTPYYVAPEQLSGRSGAVDARTDVYSLGVTLYELLALRRPFDGDGTAQIFRQIQSREPTLLRRANPLVPHDLETICQTAMEKDPSRRYPTMAALAADLQRFLAFEKVQARPVGLFQRGVRFARRNPAAAAALALGMSIVVGLPIGLAWTNALVRDGLDRAESAAQEARAEADLRSEVVEFLVGLFHMTGDLTARELLDRGVASLPTEFEDHPLVNAALMQAAGRVYANLGRHDEATRLLDRAFAMRQRELGGAHADVAAVLVDLARVRLDRLSRGDVTADDAGVAARLARRAIDALDRSGLAESPAAADAHLTAGRADAARRKGDDARLELERALGLRLALFGGESDSVAEVREELGLLALSEGDDGRALVHLEDALAVRRRAWVPDPEALADCLDDLARVHDVRGERATAGRRRDEAARLREAAREPVREGAIAYPFDFRPAWQDAYDESFQAGVTYLQAGRHADSIAAFERCLEWDPRQARCAYNLACGHSLAGDVPAALDWLERATRLGFAYSKRRVEIVTKDQDLAPVRATERGQRIVAEIHADWERAQEYASEPGVYVPASAPEGAPLPLLIVLHANGDTKERLIDGAWRGVAERRGMVLLAPSGTVPTASDPLLGMAWSDGANRMLEQPWLFERPVVEAIRTYLERNDIDRDRVLIAGEGMGAMLAFDLALQAPGLFRGVLLCDGPVHPASGGRAARIASTLGLSVRVLLDEDTPVPGRPRGDDASTLAGTYRRWLDGCGLGERARIEVDPVGEATPIVERLDRAVAELLGERPR